MFCIKKLGYLKDTLFQKSIELKTKEGKELVI